MLIVVWFVRLEIDHREIYTLVLTYLLTLLLWIAERLAQFQVHHSPTTADTQECIAPPAN